MVRLAAAAAAVALVVLSPTAANGGSHSIRALWVADAVCETGSTPPAWHTRAGVYEGGIRFFHGTWLAWRTMVPGAARYSHADYAPAWLQAAVAEQGLRRFGRWGCLFNAGVWAHR